MITEIYVVIRTHQGYEEIMYMSPKKKAAVDYKNNREWSHIENTGTSRNDLSLRTYRMVEDDGKS